MTAKETATLEKLRDELHEYHVGVKELAVRCDERFEEFSHCITGIKLDLDGERPPNEQAPGLKARVAEHEQKWRALRIGLRCAWGVLTLLLGAVVTSIMKSR